MRKSSERRRDQLVTINQEVLRALMDERGLTTAALSRRSGESEQTLAHILNNPGARCMKSRRGRIAKALQVPQELLAGESFPVPVGFMLPDGFEFRYSPRTQLAASRFIARVGKAVRRDLRINQVSQRSDAPPTGWVEGAVISALSEFMMIGEWRKRFIEWEPHVQQQRGYTEPATVRPWEGDPQIDVVLEDALLWSTRPPRRERDSDHEAAILGVVRAMEHMLEPWFQGTARLNYRSVRDFVHLPNHPFVEVQESHSAFSPDAILPPAQDPPTIPVRTRRTQKH